MAKTAHLTVQQVAHWLGVDVRTVYRLVRRRKLPGFKVGSQWRFNQQMLEAWVHQQVAAKPINRHGNSSSSRRRRK